jgi:hypothetical protein
MEGDRDCRDYPAPDLEFHPGFGASLFGPLETCGLGKRGNRRTAKLQHSRYNESSRLTLTFDLEKPNLKLLITSAFRAALQA